MRSTDVPPGAVNSTGQAGTKQTALSCAGDQKNIPSVSSTLSRTPQFFYIFVSFNCVFLKMTKVYIIPPEIDAQKGFLSNLLLF